MAYKSPEFSFRTNSLGLKGIPSLYHFSRSGVMTTCEKGLSDGTAFKLEGVEGVKRTVDDFLKTV